MGNRLTGKRVVLGCLGLAASMASAQTTGNVVKFQGTLANVKYVYATAEPVAHLKPGDILDTNTLDCFGDAIRKPGDRLSVGLGGGRIYLFDKDGLAV